MRWVKSGTGAFRKALADGERRGETDSAKVGAVVAEGLARGRGGGGAARAAGRPRRRVRPRGEGGLPVHPAHERDSGEGGRRPGGVRRLLGSGGRGAGRGSGRREDRGRDRGFPHRGRAGDRGVRLRDRIPSPGGRGRRARGSPRPARGTGGGGGGGG